MVIKLNDTWYNYCAADRTSVDNLTHAQVLSEPITIKISEATVP